MARNLISDDEWILFERFIRAVWHPNGREPTDHRLVLDGIFWIARTGAPWRDLPKEFGKWSPVYRQFRRWTLAGLWEDILDALNHAGVAPDKLQMVDTTVIRAHHHAAGAKGGTPKEALGRSRGGLSTKIHLRVNGAGLPMRTEITPGQNSDYTGYDLVMAESLLQPAILVADRGYDSDKVREAIEGGSALPMIPMRKNPRVRQAVDMTIYTLRNMVERCFNTLLLQKIADLQDS